MPLDYEREDSSHPEGVIVQQEVIPSVDNVLADRMTVPELNDELKPAKECSYKRPWLLPITAIAAMIQASTIAPRTELYIKFVCDELRPEYRVDVSLVRWDSASKDTKVDVPKDVPVTFMQSNPVLDDQIMKPTLLHPDKRCAQDPEVQRAAAKLSAAITSTQGILSFLTLGWWTQYSDRAGRTRVLGISALATLFADALLLLVAFKSNTLPGGYRILLLGGVFHGISGGFSACIAAGHAYVADCSSPSARSRIFSFWTGCVYAGAAVGPSLGSLINYYSNDLLSTYYASGVTHIIYGIFMVFLVPESLSDEARAKARELYEADMNLHPNTMLGYLWRLTSVIRPLGVFIPGRLPAMRGEWSFRDWNLALVGVAAAAVAINIGSYPFKYQYAMKTFQWNSVQLGYWLSLVGFCRAFYLSVILPIIIKALYAREERLSNANSADNDDEKEAQVKKIDLLVARASLMIDLVGYISVGIVTSQIPFVGATIILAFGGGFNPSTQSLALALSNPSAHIARREARARRTNLPSNAKQEIGRLFGALAVIHALGAQIIGPALFSTVFGKTVGAYPRAFFWVSSFLVALALGALGAVRLDIGTSTEVSEHTPLLV